jgi:peptidoglycan/LPS O-acetylase OafA/YrhL
MNRTYYRPEIDGLRALAILSVAFFHAEMGFGGGYAGVDIFFVISGFLITSILYNDAAEGRPSLLQFWERRVRRIFPALSVVLAFCVFVGSIVYFPANLIDLGKQLRAQSLFSSNILFFLQSGYFDSSSELKALLHTWSLAIEEQFYLFFPLIFFTIYRVRKEILFPFVIVMAGVSLACSVFWLGKNLDGAAFYLLPSRAWELLIGAMLALYKPVKPLLSKFAEVLGGVGLAAILYTVICFDNKTPFPGFAALLPTLGTAAIIFSATNYQTKVAKMLSYKPMVFIGLISYSWYLWHWPVISFFRYLPGFKFNALTGAICLLISFVIAVWSWRYIERPFRAKDGVMGRKALFTTALAILLLCAGTGHYFVVKEGLPKRMSEASTRLASGMFDNNPYEDCVGDVEKRIVENNLCETKPEAGKPKFLAWGDSFANSMVPGFYHLADKHNVNGYIATYSACPPILGLKQRKDGRVFTCADFNDGVLSLIKKNDIKKVFLIGNWYGWMREERKTHFDDESWYEEYKDAYSSKAAAGLKHSVKILRDMGVEPIVVVAQAYAMEDPARYLALEEMYDIKPRTIFISRAENREHTAPVIDPLMDDLRTDGVKIIDFRERLCDETQCRIQHDGYSLYSDRSHLSSKGAVFVSPLFEPYIK